MKAKKFWSGSSDPHRDRGFLAFLRAIFIGHLEGVSPAN